MKTENTINYSNHIDNIPLLPCPFCGSRVDFKQRPGYGDIDWENTYWDVRCENEECYLQDGADWHLDSPMEAAEIWNKRQTKQT